MNSSTRLHFLMSRRLEYDARSFHFQIGFTCGEDGEIRNVRLCDSEKKEFII